MTAAASPETIEFFRQLQPGQRLAGCYLLIKQVIGAPDRLIWLANDEVLGKDVALHFLPQELVGQSDVADRLKQEVKRNRPLIHPHILRTYDFVEEEGWSAITTDSFDGLTLAGALEDGAREASDVSPWVEQICSTLDEAHRIRIAHGALTPQEIVLTGKGDLKLMNFGISAVIRDAMRSSRSEAVQRMLAYASPQQLEGAKPGVLDDVFALGAVVHALLVGEPPFRGAERGGLTSIAQHRSTLGHRGDPVPASWEGAVSAALSAEPATRPATPSQFLQLARTPIEVSEAVATAPEPSIPKESAAPPAPAPVLVVPEQERTSFAPSTAEPSGVATVAAAESSTALKAEADETTPTPEQVEPIAQRDVSLPPTGPGSEENPPEPAHAAERSQAASDSATEITPAAALDTATPSDREEPQVEISSAPGAEERVTAGSSSVDEPAPEQSRADAVAESKMKTEPNKAEVEPTAPRKAGNTPVSPRGGKRRIVPTVAEEELAERVRREEEVEEARDRGYNDEEDYPPPRSGSPTRMAIPLVAAAVGLLILFGLIKWFVGAPEGTDTRRSSSQNAGTNAQSGTAEQNSSPTPEPEKAQSPTATGNLPAESERNSARVETAPELPEKRTPEVGGASAVPTAPTPTVAQERDAALEKVKELEAKLTTSKKDLEEKSKALPQLQKGADELASQQKKRDDAAAKAEQAAAQAEQTATEKRRVADDARKTATDLAEQIKARREEHARTQDEITTLQGGMQDDQKALIAANEAAAAAAKRIEEERRPQPAPAEIAASPAIPPAVDKDDSDAARARNDERRKIDEEMAALRKKLAEQAQKLGATLDAARTPDLPKDKTSQGSKTEATTTAPTQPPPVQATPAPLVNAPELALNKTVPPPAETIAPPQETPKTARAGANGEFMNSLGMKFVAVPGTEAVFCIWPSRVRDFEPFARSTGLKSTLWKDPGFKQGPEHPVVNVTWQEAVAFCKWLTAKEQKEGLIASDQSYRLPTDLEWSAAVGLSNESGKSPEERDMSVPDVYPWGSAWPPPSGAGNYTGEETGSDVAIKGYDDSFPWTSPVGSFPANKAGLFDMGGNVWEWCMDTWNSESKARVLRGASWYNGALKLSLLSSCRVHASPDSGTDNYGFRVVLAVDGKSKR